jgi:flagellar motor component MotA
VVALALAGGVVALGIAVNDGSTALRVISNVLVLLGGAGAAVTIALWATRVMGSGGPAARVCRDTVRVRRVAEELIACAREAESRGVLTLVGRGLGECGELFRLGADMVVAGESVDVLRARLAELGDRAGESAARMRERIVAVCRWLPVVALVLSLVLVVWMLVSVASPARLGTLTPMGLLLSVYGAFAVAAIAVEVGDRVLAEAAERELITGMVIQTLSSIRSGESAARIESHLRGVLTPGAISADEGAPLRRAA